MRRRAFALLAAGLAVTGCVPSGYTPPGGIAQAVTTTAPPQGERIGLLLPLSGPNASVGHQLMQAAELAASLPGARPILLDPRDTAGTPAGAAAAAQQAIASGDRILVGPLTAPETAAAAPAAVAVGVPMLAFTSDPAQARPGVWTLGVTPGQQVRRLIAGAQADGRTRFAAVLPDSPLGQAMGNALPAYAPEADTRSYPSGNTTALQAALADISDYAGRHAGNVAAPSPQAASQAGAARPAARPAAPRPTRAPFRGLSASGDVVPGAGASAPGPNALDQPPPAPVAPPPQVAPAPAPTPVAAPVTPPPPPFDALLVGETGRGAAALGPLLSRDDITQPRVRVLGPGLWQRDADRLGSLAGAWFAAPDAGARAEFVRLFRAKYGVEPPPLADIAFDATAIARILAQTGDFSVTALTKPEGFAGSDGVLGLLADGHVRRALAIFEIKPGGGARVVSPAPTNLGAPGV